MQPQTQSSITARIGDWVDSPRVQGFIVTLIVINAITLGLETSTTVMRHAGTLINLVEDLILAVFVAEIGLKLIAYRMRFFASGWNLFDFTIVAIALVPASGPFAILRAFRILRVLRLVTKIKRLRHLVEALLQALPSIGWIVVLLLMIFYIFGVMGTRLFGDAFPEYFGNLGRTLYTLFQIMTLESWSHGIARPVMSVHPYAWIYFLTFVLITVFTVLNLFIGIIVNTMQEKQHQQDSKDRQRQEDRAHQERDEMLQTLHRIDERMTRLEARLPAAGDPDGT